jgi:4-hydroxybenzoate polyprenyltransferase
MVGSIHKLINWILYTSFFAASCAVGMCMATEQLINAESATLFNPLHVLVFGGVLLVYNTHFLLQKSTPELSERFGWSQHYRLWHYISISIGLVCLGYSLFKMPAPVISACVVLAVLSFAYSLPMLPIVARKRLKDYGWVKIGVLTSVWTIVTAVLPMLYYSKPIEAYPFEIGIRFALMFPLCLAFDVRDMQTDVQAGIFTVPNRIGIKNTYRLMNAVIVLFVVFSVIQYVRYPSVGRIAAELIAAIAMKWVTGYARTHSTDKAYLGLVDGVMLLYALLIIYLQ